jgi:hypothetical protein
MDTTLIKDQEREFFVVWKILSKICGATSHGDLLRFETQRDAETLLYLMRSADCIDPSLVLDGTDSLRPISIGD